MKRSGFSWLSELHGVKTASYADELSKAVKRYNDVLVVTILEEHIDLLCVSKNWRISTRQRGRKRVCTGDVPAFVWVESSDFTGGSKTLVVAVPPNREFAIHVAQFVRNRMNQLIQGTRYSLDDNLQLWIFNAACNSVMEMLRLDNLETSVNGSFIMLEDGDNHSCCSQFEQSHQVAITDSGSLLSDWSALPHNAYFKYRVLTVKGKVQDTKVVFIQPKIMLWGNLATSFVKKLSRLGVKGVVLVGKVDADKNLEDLNAISLFVPTKFCWLDLMTGSIVNVDEVVNFLQRTSSSFAKVCSTTSVPLFVGVSVSAAFAKVGFDGYNTIAGYLGQGIQECSIKFGVVLRGADSPILAKEQASLVLQFFLDFDDENPYRKFGIRSPGSFGAVKLYLDDEAFAWSPSFFEATDGVSTKSLRDLMTCLNGEMAFSGKELKHLAAFFLFLTRDEALRAYWAPEDVLSRLPEKIEVDRSDVIVIDPRASEEISASCAKKFVGAKAILYKATKEGCWSISFSWRLFEKYFEEDSALKTYIQSLNRRLWRHRLLVLVGPSAAGKTTTLKRIIADTFSKDQETTMGGSFVRVLMKRYRGEYKFSLQEMGKAPWPSEPSDGPSSLFSEDDDVPMNVESSVMWLDEDVLQQGKDENVFKESQRSVQQQRQLVSLEGHNNNIFITSTEDVPDVHLRGHNNNVIFTSNSKAKSFSAPSESAPQEQEVLVSVWDLGGQRIYYYLQHLMLNRQSRAVLVWDGTKPLTKDGVEFWKRVVAPSALPIILVVMTRSDNVSSEERNAQEERVKKFLTADTKTMWIDNQTGNGVPKLKQEMYELLTSLTKFEFVVVSKSVVLLLESLQRLPPGFVTDNKYLSKTEKLRILAYQVGQSTLVEKENANVVVNRPDWLVEAAATFIHEYRDFENGSIISTMKSANVFSEKEIQGFQRGKISRKMLFWLWGFGQNCPIDDGSFSLTGKRKRLQVFAGVDGLCAGKEVIETRLSMIVDVLVYVGILVRRPRKQTFVIPAFAWRASPGFSPFQFILVGALFLPCGFVGVFLNRLLLAEVGVEHVAIQKLGITVTILNEDRKVHFVVRQTVFQDSMVLSVQKMEEHTPSSLVELTSRLEAATRASFEQLKYLFPTNCKPIDLFAWKMSVLSTVQNSAKGKFFSSADVFPYGTYDEKTLSGVSSVAEHTLLNYLQNYVEQKTASFMFDLHCAVQNNSPVLIVGILKEYAESWISDMGWDVVRFNDSQSQSRREKVLDLPFVQSSKKKWFNTERAAAYWIRERDSGTEGLVVVCPPGRCYVQHVAEMTAYAVERLKLSSPYAVLKSENMIRTWNFRCLDGQLFEPGFMNLAQWLRISSLNEAVVVLGYSEFFSQVFQNEFPSDEWTVEDAEVQAEDLSSKPFFMAKTFSNLRGKKVVFLSMRYPFWGEVAGQLVKKLLECNVSTILYGAKLGCISSHLHVLSKLFIPSRFSLRDIYSEGVQEVGVENCLWDRTYASWCIHESHISVPTIISETQLRVGHFVEQYQAASLDNEISFMAKAVADFNKRVAPAQDVRFGCVHYATDYLNWDTDKIRTQSNMTNTDAKLASKLKEQQARIINNYLRKAFFVHDNNAGAVFEELERLALLWYEEIQSRCNKDQAEALWKLICPIGQPGFCSSQTTVSCASPEMGDRADAVARKTDASRTRNVARSRRDYN